MRSLIEQLGGRRYVLTVFVFIVTSVLLWHGKLNSADYQWITMGTVAAYIAGNVTQRIKVPNENQNKTL